MKSFALTLACCAAIFAQAQEQVDLAESRLVQAASLKELTMRVRATRVEPATEKVRVLWRRGGEGLGGTVTRGEFLAESGAAELAPAEWSAWAPLEQVAGHGGSWQFITFVVEGAVGQKVGIKKAAGSPLSATTVEFEFADKDKTFKTIKEDAPNGATVGIAFPLGKLDAK